MRGQWLELNLVRECRYEMLKRVAVDTIHLSVLYLQECFYISGCRRRTSQKELSFPGA